MAFRDDVPRIPGLEAAYCNGLRALRQEDRQHLVVSSPRSLRGSVDLDSALRRLAPDAARWDYVIASLLGNPKCEWLLWIEVHSATSGANLAEVRAKYHWLRGWLKSGAKRLAGYPREFVWIASGRCAFHAGMPVIKKLATEGVQFVGRCYLIQA